MRIHSKVLQAVAILGMIGASAANIAGQETATSGNTRSAVLLLLGSSNPETRAIRVGLACDLIRRKDVFFDRIILSGGCGAHGTDVSNCEASDMQRLLTAACGDAISAIAVYKEEKSGSTVENYCFSRGLQSEGRELIRKGDTLYVVSNHHHALSVAACFRNEGVDARYYYTCGGSFYEGAAPSISRLGTAGGGGVFQAYNWCYCHQDPAMVAECGVFAELFLRCGDTAPQARPK